MLNLIIIKNKLLSLLPVVLLTLISFILVACSGTNKTVDEDNQNIREVVTEKPLVMTSIYPIYSIAHELAGDKIQVKSIIPPGESPHVFNPTVSTKKNINNSAAVFYIGHGLDDWVLDLVDDKLKAISVDKNIILRKSEHTHEEHGHEEHGDEKHGHEEHEDEEHEDEEHGDEKHEDEEHGDEKHGDEKHVKESYDPHYWLDPRNAKLIANTIIAKYIEINPDNSKYYQTQLSIFHLKIDELYRNSFENTRDISKNPFITFHDAWHYFAEAFALDIVGTFEPVGSEHPSPKYLKNLQDKITKHKVKVLFSEPQLSTSSLNTFIKDNDLIIGILDPLGGIENRMSYEDLILYNIETIINSFKEFEN